MGWAFAPDGDVCCAAGGTLSEPTDGCLITCYAKWSELKLAAESADWAHGSITLRCEDTDTSGAEHTYSLEYKENDTWVAVDDDEAKNITATQGQDANGQTVLVAKLTDGGFSSRLGGLPPVEYRVKDEKTGRVSEPCVTRNRFLLSVGYSAYEKNWVTPLAQSLVDATVFKNLCEGHGEFLSRNTRLLRNNEATVEGIRVEMANFAQRTQPGDLFVFYIATHGGDSKVTFHSVFSARLCAYDARGYYFVEALQRDLRAFNSGVAIISIVMACHAKSLIGAIDERPGREWINSWMASCGFGQCLGNIAWVASCDSSQSSYNSTAHSMFGQAFIADGFGRGCADMRLYGTEYEGVEPDGLVTVGELGRYAKEFAKGWSDNEPSDVQLDDNGGLLDRIVLGRRTTTPTWSRPATPVGVTASDGYFDKYVTVEWAGVASATSYRIYRYPLSSPDEWKWIGSSNGTDFKDETAALIREYGYRVQAVNPIGVSELSYVATGSRGTAKILGFLDSYFGTSLASADEYDAMERTIAPNGYSYGDSFVAGLVPTNAASKFTIELVMTNGVPVVSWLPDLGEERHYTVYGKESLGDAYWMTPTNSTHRFFKVTVEMP